MNDSILIIDTLFSMLFDIWRMLMAYHLLAFPVLISLVYLIMILFLKGRNK